MTIRTRLDRLARLEAQRQPAAKPGARERIRATLAVMASRMDDEARAEIRETLEADAKLAHRTVAAHVLALIRQRHDRGAK